MSSTDRQSFDELMEASEGKSLTQISVQGFGAWMLAILSAAAAGFQDAVDFLFLPFRIFVDVATASVNAFLLEPMGITEPAWAATVEGLLQFELFAGPVSVLFAMTGLAIVIAYLAIPYTSNFLPGILVDNPLWDFLFNTAEEEDED